MNPDAVENIKESWWRRWLVRPIINQLTAGISVDRISWSIALGSVLGIFPILGSPTLICLFVGWIFRLNHAILQVFKELVYPLHLALILVFIRIGEYLCGAPQTSFSIPQLIEKFHNSPIQFGKDFGMTALYAVIAWMVIAPFSAILIKVTVMPLVKRLAGSLRARKELVL
ncbi:MAG: DUF2062 domain-containing protein [Akkermansiaceae bacterium]|nr:DUF2062 domain-containing protein [Akkermansiaceae bacterium]NJR42768.1 DUF2062 domain-containing protein [Akkermansiaceae bacterium]